jgi:hypothetical protein
MHSFTFSENFIEHSIKPKFQAFPKKSLKINLKIQAQIREFKGFAGRSSLNGMSLAHSFWACLLLKLPGF